MPAWADAGMQETAETREALPLIPVTLIAPEPVRPLLAAHLDLTVRFAIAESLAVLARRASADVADLLATEGYFSPLVKVYAAAAEKDGLVVEVDPGSRTQVENTSIEFLGHLAGDGEAEQARRAELRMAWTLNPGMPFRSPDWEAAKAALLTGATAADYAAARITASRAEVDPAQATARLAVTLDSGMPYRFGPLTIQGLKRYDEALVLRLSPFQPGEPYRRDRLLAFQSRLQSTPLFHSVIVEADPATADGDGVPVEVTLAEAPSRRIGFGLGFSTNSGPRSEVNYRNLDFLGRAWNFGGGLRLESNRQTLFGDLALQPDGRGYQHSFGGRLEASEIQGLASTRQVLGVTRSRAEGRIETQWSLEWQSEERRPSGAATATDQALTLDWRWLHRDVDDALNPRSGNLIELRLGGASKQLLSDRNFLRGYLRGQQWWALGQRDMLTLRGEAGATAALSRFGIPQDYLFRTGGAQSVRGYAYQSLGVREGEAVVGGRALLTGSLEHTRWLDDQWGAALFIDAGDAADHWSVLKPAVGIGAGARWRSPAGPLALDLARGLDIERWQFHFSLMVAF